MTRKLTKQTIKPILHYTKTNINSEYHKAYAFTLDYYDSKPSWQGMIHHTVEDAMTMPYTEQYVLDLDTGKVYDTNTKQVVMEV